MRPSQSLHFVPVLASADQAAGVDGESINLGKGQSLTFLIQFGSLTGNAALTINSGASDGTKTTAETFHYALGSAAAKSASADVLGAYSTSASLTLTASTYANKLLVVTVDHDDITDAQPWITLNLSSAASALNAAVVAILTPRYGGDQAATVLT